MRDIEESLFQDIATTVIKLVLIKIFSLMKYAPGVREDVKGHLFGRKKDLKQTGAIRLLKFVVSAEVRILILPLLFITHIRCFKVY